MATEQQPTVKVENREQFLKAFDRLPPAIFRHHILANYETLAEVFTFLNFKDRYQSTYPHIVLKPLRALKRFSVLSAPVPNPDGDNAQLFVSRPMTGQEHLFLSHLIISEDFKPAKIELEQYRTVGIMPEENPENAEPVEKFNPLLHLHKTGNAALLKRIYDCAVKKFEAQERLTTTSHECFNSSELSMTTMHIWDNQAVAPTADHVACMNYYMMAKWAICTYQEPCEFKRHYMNFRFMAEKLGKPDTINNDAVQMLLFYAETMKNSALLEHIIFDESYGYTHFAHIGVDHYISEGGLDIPKTLSTSAQRFVASNNQGSLNIIQRTLSVCSNPDDLKCDIPYELRKKIVLALINQIIEDMVEKVNEHNGVSSEPTAREGIPAITASTLLLWAKARPETAKKLGLTLKIFRLKDAIEKDAGPEFVTEYCPPKRTLTTTETEMGTNKRENRFLIPNLFHFARPLFEQKPVKQEKPATSLLANLSLLRERGNRRRAACRLPQNILEIAQDDETLEVAELSDETVEVAVAVDITPVQIPQITPRSRRGYRIP